MDVNENVRHCDVGLATGGALKFGLPNKSHMLWQCLCFHSLREPYFNGKRNEGASVQCA